MHGLNGANEAIAHAVSLLFIFCFLGVGALFFGVSSAVCSKYGPFSLAICLGSAAIVCTGIYLAVWAKNDFASFSLIIHVAAFAGGLSGVAAIVRVAINRST